MTPDAIAQLKARLRIPVMAGPMFIASTADLVIAQCRAGIIGDAGKIENDPSDKDSTIDRTQYRSSRSNYLKACGNRKRVTFPTVSARTGK